jgi:hypothetical protein
MRSSPSRRPDEEFHDAAQEVCPDSFRRFAPRRDGYYSAGASSATSRRCGATLSVRLR